MTSRNLDQVILKICQVAGHASITNRPQIVHHFDLNIVNWGFIILATSSSVAPQCRSHTPKILCYNVCGNNSPETRFMTCVSSFVFCSKYEDCTVARDLGSVFCRLLWNDILRRLHRLRSLVIPVDGQVGAALPQLVPKLEIKFTLTPFVQELLKGATLRTPDSVLKCYNISPETR